MDGDNSLLFESQVKKRPVTRMAATTRRARLIVIASTPRQSVGRRGARWEATTATVTVVVVVERASMDGDGGADERRVASSAAEGRCG